MRVAVLADCHIDHNIHGLWAHNAWQNATNSIAEEEFDVCVIAGDLFHTGKPTTEALLVATDGLKKMTRSGVEVAIVNGNHEWIGVNARRGHRPPIAMLGELPNVKSLWQETCGTRVGDLWLAAAPWPAPGAHQSLWTQREELARLAEESSGVDGPRILAGHVMVDEAQQWPGSENEMLALQESSNLIPLKELDLTDEFTAVLLGHIHAPISLGDCVSYVGSLEAFNFKDEGRVGGWLEMEWETDGLFGEEWEKTWRPSGIHKFVTVGVNDDLSQFPKETMLRLRLEMGETELDFDSEAVTSNGLRLISVVGTNPEAHEINESDYVSEEEGNLSPEELLELWSSNQGLSERHTTLLKHKSRVELGYSCCDEDDDAHA